MYLKCVYSYDFFFNLKISPKTNYSNNRFSIQYLYIFENRNNIRTKPLQQQLLYFIIHLSTTLTIQHLTSVISAVTSYDALHKISVQSATIWDGLIYRELESAL